MSELEQDILRRLLVDLFLASPRKRADLSRQDGIEEMKEKVPDEKREQRKEEKSHDQ